MWFVLLTVLMEVVLVIAGPDATAMILALLPGAHGVTAYLSCVRAALAEVGTGTVVWRFDDRGLRVEGETSTEIPWSRMARWRRASDHLIIEVRNTNPKKPNHALAAPLAPIEPEWHRIEPRLRSSIGPVAPTS
jgi:hypothetical protein